MERYRKYNNFDGVVNTEWEALAIDPIEEVKKVLLNPNRKYLAKATEIGCRPDGLGYVHSRQYADGDPRLVERIKEHIEYCKQMYAVEDTQWQIIQEEVEKMERTNPLRAKMYHEAFGK